MAKKDDNQCARNISIQTPKEGEMSIITNDLKIDYPLKGKIGSPELFVGREPEFQKFHKWINNMLKELSKSQAFLGRRGSGKTAFVQRLFNQIWSANG